MKNTITNKPKRLSYNIRISKQDAEIIKKLRNTYCVNISVFIRKSINDLYDQLKKKKWKKINWLNLGRKFDKFVKNKEISCKIIRNKETKWKQAEWFIIIKATNAFLD